jgi:hypothetical protein
MRGTFQRLTDVERSINFVPERVVNYALRPKAVEMIGHGARSSISKFGSDYFFAQGRARRSDTGV